ncbi:MAG: cytochrome b/b6 domain-containing protein [Leptolyngbyaceae cyanobacterium SL_1_1]|nr:cytochrome b/b6 domain-containing protein [Leptolyngbyaceae cyanobacterium RM1_1_2]NJO10713.1 cytochrome b/b6 domain-containing protein [Leptolyngbyaceae cyanobacterium SL_1_1]
MTTQSRKRPAVPKQALLAKAFHWVNIISLLLMMTSGLQIYNANPVFGGRAGWHFPDFFLLGGWLAGGRHWHFAMMWIFSLNLLLYGLYIFITRRWKRRFVSTSDIQVLQAGQNPKRKAYSWHRLVYTAIIPVLLLAIASGLSMYKPAQLHWLSGLFINWQILRTVHFITVPIVVLFAFVHSLLALKVGQIRLVKSMFT